MENKEIEIRFLNVDTDALREKLAALNAQDKGEVVLSEIIFYGKDLKWRDGRQKFVRLRKRRDKVTLTYKWHREASVDGTTEIEFEVSDMGKAEAFLEAIGISAFRHQEKRRHTFLLGEVSIDIDTWPGLPAIVEFEGRSENRLKAAVSAAGLSWKDGIFDDQRRIIEKQYHVPVGEMRWFTFDRQE